MKSTPLTERAKHRVDTLRWSHIQFSEKRYVVIANLSNCEDMIKEQGVDEKKLDENAVRLSEAW